MEKFKYYFNTAAKIETVLNQPINKGTIGSIIYHLIWYAYYNISTEEKEIVVYIENWMKDRTNIFHLGSYAKTIKLMIKQIKKMPWRNITSPIVIRKSELDYISSFKDIKKEKLLFCYLAVAKFFDASRSEKTHWENESDTIIFKMARVNIPANERNYYIYDLLYKDKCKISMNNKDDDSSKKIEFVSDDENDPVVLELYEDNYRELAFTYLNWKNGGGYKECKGCGRLFKAAKNTRYCKKCTPKYEKLEYKKITCVDCGDEVFVETKDTKTCRCSECQYILNKANTRKRVQKYRETH